MAIRPILIDKRSPFLGESCALCKEPFNPGQEIIICPEDATRHHVHCWAANDNRCTAFGCPGRGEPIRRTPFAETDDDDEPDVESGREAVQTLPSSSFGCAQSCLLIAIAVTILLVGFSCFGLWAILDYILMEVLGWPYRAPFSAVIPLLSPVVVALPMGFTT